MRDFYVQNTTFFLMPARPRARQVYCKSPDTNIITWFYTCQHVSSSSSIMDVGGLHTSMQLLISVDVIFKYYCYVLWYTLGERDTMLCYVWWWFMNNGTWFSVPPSLLHCCMDCQLVKFLYCFIHCGVSVLQDCHGNPYPGHIDLVLKARQLETVTYKILFFFLWTSTQGEWEKKERERERVRVWFEGFIWLYNKVWL